MRFILAVVVVLVVLVAPVDGGGHKAAAKPKATPSKTTVTAVMPAALTITDGAAGKTLNVTPFTEIIVNGQKATLADVKPGMVVDVTLRDPTTASRITAAVSKQP